MPSAIRADLKQALRSMWSQPLFTMVVVGTLAIGIGANTAMFALIHAAMLKPLPFAEPDRLVLVRRTLGPRTLMLNSTPDYYDYKQGVAGFDSLAATSSFIMRLTIAGEGEPERVPIVRVSHDWFSTLGVRLAAGRSFSAGEAVAGAPLAALVSERLADRRFGGTKAAVGRSFKVSAIGPTGTSDSATIVGVVPNSYQFLGTADAWVPIRKGERDGPETRRFHNWVLVGRLRPGMSIPAVQAQADVVAGRLQAQYPDTNKVKGLRIDPLQSALLAPQAPRLMLLMGAVGLVLLIACANVAGMLVARGVARRGELAVRGALGASRGRLATQLLIESLAISIVAGLAGVLLALWLRRLLPLAIGLPASSATTGGLDLQVLAFAFLASIVTGVLCGVAPALRVASVNPADVLAPGARAATSRGGARLRSLLVAAQVALSLVLLVGAGLLVRSLSALMSTELGFEANGLAAITIDSPDTNPAGRVQYQDGLLEEISAIPGVTAAALCSQVPILNPGGDPPMYAASRPPVDSSQEQTALLRAVSPGFFKVTGIRLLAGRDIQASDRPGAPLVMVVNEVMAREFFPGENPLGQHVILPGAERRDYEIVGIVSAARAEAVGREPDATVYVPASQQPLRLVSALVRTDLPSNKLTAAVKRIVAARGADLSVEPAVRLSDVIGESLAPQRVVTITLSAFSAIALFLAGLGLYGVLAYHVSQRTQEIGVRLALGADTRHVLVDVLRRSAAMVVPGLAAGLLASFASRTVIAGLLYGVPPTDPGTYVAVCAALIVVATASSLWPAWRATRVNPVTALRG